MNRVRDRRIAEAYRAALDVLPAPVRHRAASDVLCGADAVFVGLHGCEEARDGRSFRGTSHTCYDFFAVDRRTAIILYDPEPWVALHEMGHVVHQTLGLEPAPVPLDEYAATNHREAFATAFEAYFTPQEWLPDYRSLDVSPEGLRRYDPGSFELFERLSRGDAP